MAHPNVMLTPAYLTGAVKDKPSEEFIRQRYAALEFLPWFETPERNVIWDVMANENNLAGFYGPRGQAVPGDDLLFDSYIVSLADIKASRNLETWALQIIRDPGMPQVYRTGGSSHVIQGMQQRVRDHINKRLAWCNKTVDAQVEYMGMHALQGSIAWPPVDQNGNAISNPMPHWNYEMEFTIPIPLPSSQNQAVTTLTGYNDGTGARTGAGLSWKNASATPFNDLAIANEYMLRTKGVALRGGTVIMSETVLEYMARNTSILNWLAGSNYEQPGARGFASFEELKDAIKAQFGWTIRTYDAQWTYRENDPGSAPTVQRVDFLKAGKIIILPPGGPVGKMLTSLQEHEDSSWDYGKMGWSHRAPKPPYDTELGVNLVAWPTFDYYDWFVLDVFN